MSVSLLNYEKDSDSLDLHGQLEELKGLLRGNDLLLKDQQFKYNKMVENYETQIARLNEDNKQVKEKYEKIFEAQRKLEKLNSSLEDRLLKIVEKYENEQKSLLEELTIAHSQLVEAKLNIDQLENEKESFRQDCNLAVNLLQCKPSEFVSHSYNSLPVNLKERLRSYLSNDDIIKLESETENENEMKNKNTILKIPVFQPTAAAAMMYNIQNNNSLQREKLKSKKIDQETSNLFGLGNLGGLLNYTSASIDNENLSLKKNDLLEKKVDETCFEPNDYGKVSSSLIAQVLKKETDNKSKKSFKLFPYICLRCKKEAVLCDSPTQTCEDDLIELDTKIIYGHAKSIFSDTLLRSKTVGNNLSEMENEPKHNKPSSNTLNVNRNHHKCASTDLGNTFKNSFII